MANNDRPVSPINGQPIPDGKPFGTSDERAREAGIASGKSRAAKRDLRKALEYLLEKDFKGKSGETLSGAEAIALKQMEKALKGDTRAFEVIRDTSGQKPVDKVVVSEVDPDVVREVEKMVMGGNDEGASG